MPPTQLQTNDNGGSRLCPITSFEVQVATNQMVIVLIHYVESIDQFDSGQIKQFQAVLSAEGAHELAATLEKAAQVFFTDTLGSQVQ